jgi:hypothetical protein
LVSRCQRPITARASARLANTSSFRHSSRNLLMKLSTQAFSVGLPGAL